MARFSEDQLRQAKSVDLLSWLEANEPGSFKPSGPGEFCLNDHDSLKISHGKWFWFSRGFGGTTALDYLVKVRGIDFVTAVKTLIGESAVPAYERAAPKARLPKQEKPFSLPAPNVNNDRVIAYLRGRGIDQEIINGCIRAGQLYENARNHCCVFVGLDGSTPRFASLRSTTTNSKWDVAGSDKRFSFRLPPKEPESRNLAVFEAPVDALAHATIHKIGQSGWDGYRLALFGINSAALFAFLELRHEITSVQLCLDNDQPGKDATHRIIQELAGDGRFSGLTITVAPPPVGKDYADTLKAIRERNIGKTNSDRQRAAAI
jgi:hypothetical protein